MSLRFTELFGLAEVPSPTCRRHVQEADRVTEGLDRVAHCGVAREHRPDFGLNVLIGSREPDAAFVAEATMNAMEHGNRYRSEVPVVIEVLSSGADLSVRIDDQGRSLVPDPNTEMPDLEAKLEELQTPRGWGLFLIGNMVDEMHIASDEVHHTVGLVMHLEGGEDAG